MFSTPNIVQETQRKREEEQAQLREELGQIMSRLDQLELDMKKMAASRQQMEEVLSGAAQQAQDKEDAFRVKKRTLDLLPDAQNNIHKLQVSRGVGFAAEVGLHGNALRSDEQVVRYSTV